MRWGLRPYQKRWCRTITDCFKCGPEGEPMKRLLGEAATGAGKTIMGSALIFERQKRPRPERCLFLCDTNELCDQALDKIRQSTGIIPDLEKASARASMHAQVVVGSIQTMAGPNRLARWPADHFGFVLADEAHMSMADTWQRVLKHFGSADLLGVTATPERGDKRSLLKFYQHLAAKVSLKELIDEQMLSPIVVQTAQVVIPVTAKVGDTAGDDEAVAEDIRPYWHAVLDSIDKYASDRKRILIFHPSVKASQEFTAMAQDRGIAAAHVDGASPDRAEVIEGFQRGQFRMLNNAQLLTKGFDCPEIDCVIILRPTRSRGAYIQMVGRGTRLFCPHGCAGWCAHPDRKQDMLLLDFLWHFETHDVMGPADLVTDVPVQKKAVADKIATDEPMDLFMVDEQVTDEREQRLIRAMKEAAKRRASRFDARALAAVFRQPELLDYEPMAEWEVKPVSPAQATILEKWNVDPETVTSRGQASALIGIQGTRKEAGLCTVNQVVALSKFGVDALQMTFEEAKAELDRQIARLPPRP